jgi:hypothetical protein
MNKYFLLGLTCLVFSVLGFKTYLKSEKPFGLHITADIRMLFGIFGLFILGLYFLLRNLF